MTVRWIFAALAVAAACSAPVDPPAITAATPPYGPVVGGTHITVTGSGFASAGAGPNRALIGGREAPLVATVDDDTLEILIPPGQQPGDAEVIVFNANGTARATGVFRYSTPPQISSVSPARTGYATPSFMAVTGSGFRDEGAGEARILLNGQPVGAVEVLDDTRLSFIAPPGEPLDEPDLELVNGRGQVLHRRAFRRVPSASPGLLMFPHGAAFAFYYNPHDGSFVSIPWVNFPQLRLTAVVRDANDDYWGMESNSRRFGRLDFRTQQLESPVSTFGWHPTMVRVGSEHYAIDRDTLRFGRFDPATGFFDDIGTESVSCCGSYGLAFDGTTLYMVGREKGVTFITTVDPETGAFGDRVIISTPANLHVEEMRFFDGVLYASNRNGTLITIDPATGATEQLPINPGRVFAMEVFQ